MIITIDQGGQGTKVCLYDHHQSLLQSFNPVKTYYPAPLHVEQNPDEVLQSIHAGFTAIQRQGSFAVQRIALATQRSSSLCWDKQTGKALTPIISWQDRRTASSMQRYQPHESMVLRVTGLRLSPHYGATKLQYCLHHYPAVRDALDQGRLAWGPLSSFLTFRLTQEQSLLCDPVNATRTLLYNLLENHWDQRLLNLFQLPRQVLPSLVPNDACFGHLNWQGNAVPLQMVQGDQSAALFGNGDPDMDACYLNMGTGAFLQKPISEADAHRHLSHAEGLLLSVTYRDQQGKSLYSLEGTVNGAASGLAWIQKRLQINNEQMHTIQKSWTFPRANAALFLNVVGGLGAPFWRSDFESIFIGEVATPSESVYAVLDSILFLIQTNLEIIDRLQGSAQVIYISGGLSQLDGLCQHLSSLSQRTVARHNDPQASSLGLVWLSGERWASDVMVATDRFQPSGNGAEERKQLQTWRAAMDDALHR